MLKWIRGLFCPPLKELERRVAHENERVTHCYIKIDRMLNDIAIYHEQANKQAAAIGDLKAEIKHLLEVQSIHTETFNKIHKVYRKLVTVVEELEQRSLQHENDNAKHNARSKSRKKSPISVSEPVREPDANSKAKRKPS